MQHETRLAVRPGLVSIIIPCYNAERFLTETLESVFVQTYPQTEVIIIDDGSTDGTAELIRSYADRVKVRDKTAFRECIDLLYEVVPADLAKDCTAGASLVGFKVAGVLLAARKGLRSMPRRSVQKLPPR